MKNSTRTSLFLVNLCAALLGFGAHAADPFQFTAPKNWRPERIPFPLGFAPDLKHRGLEELRFGPGMFRPGSDTYWTYVFFWWIEGRPNISAKSLQTDLVAYYRGLSKAVGGSKKLKMKMDQITATVTKLDAGKAPADFRQPRFTATLQTYDAFATGNLLTLNVEISLHQFGESNRTWLFFSVSPKPTTDPVWKTMREIRDSFEVRR